MLGKMKVKTENLKRIDMSTIEALNRLKWRTDKGGWKLDHLGNDVTAINKLINFVNTNEHERSKLHEIASKLYINAFLQIIVDLDTDVFDPISAKELNKMIELPYQYYIERFTNRLNLLAQEALFDSLGLSKGHPRLVCPEKKQIENQILYDALKEDPAKMSIFFGNAWTVEEVNENLQIQINHVLTNYNCKE